MAGASICVMLAMPTLRDLPVETVSSLWGTQKLLITRGIAPVLCIPTGCSTGAFDGRNTAAHEFLKMKECTHLFWVDSDMSWRAEDFLRIVALGTKMPVIGAVGPLKRDRPTFACHTEGEVVFDEYGCVAIKSLGLAFVCVQRKVIEELAARAVLIRAPNRKEPIRYIFRVDQVGDDLYGEDYTFCKDVRDLGYDVKIDPHIALGHIGSKEFHHGAVSSTWKPAQES